MEQQQKEGGRLNEARKIWIGRLRGRHNLRPEIVVARHARIFFSHNSVSLWALNSLIFLLSRFRYFSSDHWHSYFVAVSTSDSRAPLVEVFSSSNARIEVFMEEGDFRFFDPRSAQNTGYWLAEQTKLEWVWPKNPKKISFVFPKKSAPSLDCWVPLEKDNYHFPSEVSVRPLGNGKVFRSALVVAGERVLDVDPQQRGETYRRELVIDDKEGKWTRRPDSVAHHVGRGAYIGTSLDFLFFEALIYGLPKLAAFLREPSFAEAEPIVNDYLHPSVRKLWSMVLSERDRKPLVSPGKFNHLETNNLEVFSGGTDWLESLATAGDEIDRIAKIAIKFRDPSLRATEKVVLLRQAQSRDFANRTPLNFDRLVDDYVSRGFHPVDLGALSISDQIFIMSNARDIVSPHGGSLAHLLWVRAEAQLTEIFAGWNDDCFEKLAGSRGINYLRVVAEPVPLFEKTARGVLRKSAGRMENELPSLIEPLPEPFSYGRGHSPTQ